MSASDQGIVVIVVEQPSAADRLAVGQTLRSLAHARHPNAQTAELLSRVGEWLSAIARAELVQVAA